MCMVMISVHSFSADNPTTQITLFFFFGRGEGREGTVPMEEAQKVFHKTCANLRQNYKDGPRVAPHT